MGSLLPVFEDLLINEPVLVNDYLDVSELDKPGSGLELNPAARLIEAPSISNPAPEKLLSGTSRMHKAKLKDEEVIGQQ